MTGSCPAAQFRVNYKNGGIFYRSARDGYGFEADWSDFYPPPENLQQGDVGALPLSGVTQWFTYGIPVLGGLSSVLGGMTRALNKMAMVIVTGSVYGNVHVMICSQARPFKVIRP